MAKILKLKKTHMNFVFSRLQKWVTIRKSKIVQSTISWDEQNSTAMYDYYPDYFEAKYVHL